MCGIAGLLRFNSFDSKLIDYEIDLMTNALSHIGPDDFGVLNQNSIALGQRRLAIVDLTHYWHQPMVSTDGRYVIVFNGEIYNYKQLAKQLENEGLNVDSRNDTNVLLQACLLIEHCLS